MRNWLVALLFVPIAAFSQPYGNEWIDFNKEYYKVTVADDGIYKITHAQLTSVGFPVSSVDPRRIQLFHRGVEVAINIVGQGDAVFDPTDFIEFYGQKNDGTLDKQLYLNPADQPHNYYNLYSDSSAYFLTYNLSATAGKRMSSSIPFTGVPKDDYYNAKVLEVFTDEYSAGVTVSSYTNLTQFDVGEGFTGPRIIEVSNPSLDINLVGLDLVVPTAPSPTLELLIAGRNNTNHDFELFVGPTSASLSSLGTYSFSLFNVLTISETINWSDIGADGKMVVRVQAINDGGDQSNISVSYVKVNYPKETDLESATFANLDMKIQGSGGGVIEILNTLSASKVYDVTDANNVLLVSDNDVNPNTITCGFSDASTARTLAVSTSSSSFQLQRVSFREINKVLYDYLIISNKVLMKPSGGVPDAVRAYAGYRASAAGGGFDTLVLEIEQLYNQFSYGEVSPVSIYNFMAYMVNGGTPKYLFLIGKALDVSYKYHRQDPGLFAYHDLVPTAGSPGADLPYTANIGGATFEGAVPVGRLSVSTADEIMNYLNKVIEMDNLPYDVLWRKNLLHLSGGNSSFELSQFKSYVDGFKAVAEDIHLGGVAATVSKKTTSTVEFINVSEEVNQGLNIITFFGHSAPNVTDIDIGFVSEPANGYNNKDKYPMILMNGCNAGNIYNPDYIFGEDWIATADKGATAVIAHTSYGFPNTLKRWSDIFYELTYSDTIFIEKSVGEIQLEVGKRMLDISGSNPSYVFITQIQQMGLQGDPALKVFGTIIPDYEINTNNVEAIGLTERGVTSEADSFALALVVPNFGAYIMDSLEVAVRRRLQDGTPIDYDTMLFSPVKYQDTLVFTIDNSIANNSGVNSFEIVLDPSGKITEHDELNNSVFYNLLVPLSGTINLSPLNYSIVPAQNIDLVTQSGNPITESRGYLIELDSTFLFTSPFKQVSPPIIKKQVAIWEDRTLTSNDSSAYYWRTKYEQINPNEADQWTNSSFTYIDAGTEGWAQVAYHQFKNNLLDGMKAKEGTRTIEFLENELSIEVVVHGANSTGFTYQDTELIIDGLPFIFPSTFTLCSNNRLQIVGFNQETAAPYAPIIGNQVEQWTCGRSPQVINSYPGGKSLDEILDAIPSGDKVLLFTTGSFDFNSLSGTTIAKLEELGANGAILTSKLPSEPYIMYGLKGVGSGNSIVEIIADPLDPTPMDEQTIEYSGIVTGIYASGSVTTPFIGPAESWDQLSFLVKTPDASDIYGIDIIGSNFGGEETILFTGIQSSDFSLASIDPITSPFIKLKLNLEDNVGKTAPQLDKWLVNYLVPAEGYISYLDNSEGGSLSLSLQEGKLLTTSFGYINSSNKSFSDSLRLTYTIFNQDRRTSEMGEFNIAGPEPGDTTIFDIAIDTKGKAGLNNLDVAVNTLIIPEQIYANNNISLLNYISVTKDKANPLLEVSFDGQYIFDGDIVSPNPNIHISIRDENPYLFKTDTTGIEIFLTRPCEGCTTERISLSGDNISWVPQTGTDPFNINYSPKSLGDGVYELSVQVEDASGNKSGLNPYLIHFEVINESTITNFYPYPNPFSTSVKFVFTLTGSEIPDQILIRIFTVSGRVVREITQDELGLLRIGNNATDYAWDGRDEFGDQLANGVYLYKVIIRKNGKQIDLRESAGDRGFKNGYGKLYLLR